MREKDHSNAPTISRSWSIPFFRVPNEILDPTKTPDISSTELLVYMVLCRHADGKLHAWPSYETLAKECRISRRTAMRAIKHLLELGLLLKEERYSSMGDQTSNLYTVIHPEDVDQEDDKEGSVTESRGGDIATPGDDTATPKKIHEKKKEKKKDLRPKTPKTSLQDSPITESTKSREVKTRIKTSSSTEGKNQTIDPKTLDPKILASVNVSRLSRTLHDMKPEDPDYYQVKEELLKAREHLKKFPREKQVV